MGIIIYSNTFHSPFQFDDKTFVKKDLYVIKDLSDTGAIWDYWAGRFITFFTFALNYHFNRLDVFGYHLVNLVIHLGSAITAFWLVTLLLSAPEMKKDGIAKHANLTAFFAALIFLSHPIQTESVTYIFQRATSLAGFFYLFCLCLYIKSRLLEINGGPLSRWGPLYLFSWFLGILAMLTKENAITLPFMIILCEFCFLKTDKRMKWRYVLPFLAILPVIPILLFSTNTVVSRDIERLTLQPVNEWYYFLTQFRITITYIRLLFIPVNQNLDYDYPLTRSLSDLPSLASLLVLIVILIAAFKLFKRYRLISFSIFWFFLTILPESSLIHLKEDFIYEHWLYLPLFGYGLFLVSIAYYLFGKNFLKQMVSMLIVIAACYSILAYNRNLIWKDELTLWNDAALKSPQKARPYYSRGSAYLVKGDFRRAISDCNKAIEINPNYADAYHSRGNAYFVKGDFSKAVSDLTRAIEINPKYADAYNSRGIAYFNKGDLEQAILDLNKAIEINPEYANAYNNRGIVYFSKKEYDKSWKEVHKVWELGCEVNPRFLAELKKASGRDK